MTRNLIFLFAGMTDLPAKKIEIRHSSSLRESGGISIKCSEVVTHPMYNEVEITYDVALLRLIDGKFFPR